VFLPLQFWSTQGNCSVALPSLILLKELLHGLGPFSSSSLYISVSGGSLVVRIGVHDLALFFFPFMNERLVLSCNYVVYMFLSFYFLFLS
jgi:hypothetical protein